MNAVTRSFTDALRHPSARLTQHLRIWIGKQGNGLDVLDFKVRGGLCKDYKVDITVTSPRLDIDGREYVGLLASAPGGMAFVTPKSAQHSAGQNVIVTAGQDMDVSVVKRLRMVAGELISLCAHKLGIKIFSKGKIELQAQGAAMDLFADQKLHVSSASGDVLVDAKTKAMMASGGASMTIENGNVVFNCPGEFRIKAASFTFEGPGNTSINLPQLPMSNYQPNPRYSHTQ